MREIKFTSLQGVTLRGEIRAEMKIGRKTVALVYGLGKVYAVVDGYSLVEADQGTTIEELREMIMQEI